MMQPNPYESPGPPPAVPQRYRVHNSRVSLAEFQRIADSRVLGAGYWLAGKLRLVNLDRQVVAAPGPFLAEVCDPAAIGDPIRSYLNGVCQDAAKLEFHSPVFCAAQSSGVKVVGGAVRMLHPSQRYFLQAVASATGSIQQSEFNVVSWSRRDGQVETYATSSGRPRYRRPAGVNAQYFRDQPLDLLVERHLGWLDTLDGPLAPVASLDDLAAAVDHITTLFCQTMLDRGIYTPEP